MSYINFIIYSSSFNLIVFTTLNILLILFFFIILQCHSNVCSSLMNSMQALSRQFQTSSRHASYSVYIWVVWVNIIYDMLIEKVNDSVVYDVIVD